MFRKLLNSALHHPRRVHVLVGILVVAALVQYPRIKVDTDPENMLPADSPVRMFYRQVKDEFAIYDMIVLGIVNDKHPDGVFNAVSLKKVYDITGAIKDIPGVVASEIIAPSTKDNIEQAGMGAIKFDWLMPAPPEDRQAALKIKREADQHPLFRGTVISRNGRALALYIPIEKKDLSYEIAQKIRSICAQYPGDEKYYITGLPVANDQFGVEMFKQMAISAPLAGVVIFLLMLFFFKSLMLVAAPMILAVATVLITMGLLIGLGYPVHIMSSMIPIFLMPIAVLDSVHILSEFFERYPVYNDKKKTIVHVIEELFMPMLFTSLTSMAGFLSLSFSPIPPVQVFGVFVAVGVAVAWGLTMFLLPAYIMLINEKSFRKFHLHAEAGTTGPLSGVLRGFKKLSLQKFKIVLTAGILLVVASLYGISRIQVNDNPVRWFTASHPIRVADRVLNRHFAGTYEAYLVLQSQNKDAETFIQPAMLRYVERLQEHLNESDLVGKSITITDIVKKIYDELLGGDQTHRVIPDTKPAVAQCLISYENSHKPDDLWHFTTPSYDKLNIWIQLKSGDNKDMTRVVRLVDEFFEQHPSPEPITKQWSGLTYINVVWQDNMVVGMFKNFMGSYVIVLLMMLFLFRSPVKALISMIPLTVTILFIYSLLGFFGKDYDMPVAVLSALTLGLSIDFAIHFIQRSVEIYDVKRNWPRTAEEMFQGPGRAIIRNALVVAVGFLPLLAAPLVPYKTVGFFMFLIMAFSSVATLLILPSIFSFKPGAVFAKPGKEVFCRCRQCLLMALIAAFAVAYVLWGYTTVGWGWGTVIAIGLIGILGALCHIFSRRRMCISEEKK